MARDGLPPGWEQPIPDSIWPEALISAVRADVGVLATPRVIETIKAWREQARRGNDPRVVREAKQRLRALSLALTSEQSSDVRGADFDLEGIVTALPELQVTRERDDSNSGDFAVGDAFTADSFALPTPVSSVSRRFAATPQGRIASSDTSGSDFLPADDAIVDEASASHASSKVTPKPPMIAEEDEKPTTLRLPEALDKRPKLYRAARVDPFTEEDEKPTASIPIPEEIQRRNEKAPSHPKIPPDDTKEVASFKDMKAVTPRGGLKAVPARIEHDDEDDSEVNAEPAEERTIAGGEAPQLPTLPPPLPPSSSSGNDDDKSRRLAPKPGIVRRRALSMRKESPARPRAAMQQVRALHQIVLPLCEELIPLSVERRSRRFWARWREVAGDRGVRRDFVEDLLQTASDVRTLVCELIAEVQTVDLRSVYALVDRIDAERNTSEKVASAPKVVPPERQRGPLVGASVRVEGVKSDDE